MTDAMVTFKHLRALGFCAPGIKRWCQQNDFDPRRFREGVPASELRTYKCDFAQRAADAAEAEV